MSRIEMLLIMIITAVTTMYTSTVPRSGCNKMRPIGTPAKSRPAAMR